MNNNRAWIFDCYRFQLGFETSRVFLIENTVLTLRDHIIFRKGEANNRRNNIPFLATEQNAFGFNIRLGILHRLKL